MITSKLCKKNVAGRMVITGSLAGSKIHKSFRKNILWNNRNIASKFIILPNAAITGITKTVIEDTSK